MEARRVQLETITDESNCKYQEGIKRWEEKQKVEYM